MQVVNGQVVSFVNSLLERLIRHRQDQRGFRSVYTQRRLKNKSVYSVYLHIPCSTPIPGKKIQFQREIKANGQIINQTFLCKHASLCTNPLPDSVCAVFLLHWNDITVTLT